MPAVGLRNTTGFADLLSDTLVPSEPQWEKTEFKGQKRGQGDIQDDGCNGEGRWQAEPAALWQPSHVSVSLAGLCHTGAHYCHLSARTPGSSEVPLYQVRAIPLRHLMGVEEHEKGPGQKVDPPCWNQAGWGWDG